MRDRLHNGSWAVTMIALWLAGAGANASVAAERTRHLHSARHGVYTIDAEYPTFTGGSAVQQAASHAAERWVRGQCAYLRSNALDDYRHPENVAGSFWERDDSIRCTVTLDTPTLVSFYFEENADLGGAHPIDGVSAITIGLKNGRPKELALSDLFLANVDAPKALDTVVMPKLKRAKADFVVSGDVKSITQSFVPWSWAVSSKGIVMLFPPGSVGPEADALRVLPVPYGELSGKLDGAGSLRGCLAAMR